MTNFTQTISTPIGKLQVVANNTHIVSIQFVNDSDHLTQGNSITDLAINQLDQYFAGARAQFNLPLQLKGTEFQQNVWHALQEVAFGQTQSYSDIAMRIHRPKAVRAVGAANGRNPIPIVVPCHRIIGAGGALTGYAFGVDRKAWLLQHEAGKIMETKQKQNT